MKKLLSVAFVFLTFSLPTFAQNTFTQSYTNLAANTTTNNAVPSARVELQNRPMTILAHVGCASTNFGTFTLGFDLSLDGNIWTTLPVPLTLTFTGNPGTTNFVGVGVLSTNLTYNARFIRHSQIVGGTNALTIQKLQYRSDPP